jgi:hypothetical protein
MRPAPRRRRAPGHDERGYSLAELTIALLLTSLLFLTSVPIVATFFSASAMVSNSYTNENQLLPLSTVFQSLIRTAVSPAPTLASGEPVPPFGTYTATNASNDRKNPFSASTLTFFANVGDPHGPAKVVADLAGPAGDGTFTVTLAHATAGTCPGVTTPAPPATSLCTWGTPKNLLTVQDVVNPTIFQYVLVGANGVPVSNDSTTFATCDSSTCNAADILSVGVDLQVDSDPSKAGQAQDQTVVYQLSTTSQSYNPAVG